MRNEIVDPQVAKLASAIADAHEWAKHKVENAKIEINDAVDATVRCAALVDTAKAEWGRSFGDHWRDEVDLPDEEAKRYLAIHHSAKRCIDKSQLLLIGIIDQPEEPSEPHQQQPTDPWAWVKAAAKVKSLLSLDDLDTMDRSALEVAQLNLNPIKAVIDEIERRLAQ